MISCIAFTISFSRQIPTLQCLKGPRDNSSPGTLTGHLRLTVIVHMANSYSYSPVANDIELMLYSILRLFMRLSTK